MLQLINLVSDDFLRTHTHSHTRTHTQTRRMHTHVGQWQVHQMGGWCVKLTTHIEQQGKPDQCNMPTNTICKSRHTRNHRTHVGSSVWTASAWCGYLKSHILLKHALQLIHLLAHSGQRLLHFCHLHLAPLPVALLRLLVLHLLPWGPVCPA